MPRNNPTNEDRRRIIDSYDRGEDFVLLGRQLGWKRRTIYNAVQKYRRTGQVGRMQRGGAHNVKVDGEMRDFIRQNIERNPVVTIQQLNQALRAGMQNKPQITDSCLAKTVDGMLYSIKKVVDAPEGRNSDRTKALRREYATWLTVDAANMHNIYIDEAGYNMWTRRSRGRAIRGQPAVRRPNGQRGRNVTILLAISDRLGIVHSLTQAGGMTRERFSGFLTELSQLIGVENEANLIFDNARCHYEVPDPCENHRCIHLPPYSPQLNPIELSFSTIKADIKRRLGEIHNINIAPPDINLAQHRLELLQRMVQESLPNCVTLERCRNWYNHSRRFLPRCIAGEDLPEQLP